MRAPLTPDEDAVYLEFKRRNVKPGEEVEVIEQISESCNMSFQRTRRAAVGLLKKGYLYNFEDEQPQEEERIREILHDLLLHDHEIKELLKKVVAEVHK